MPVVIAYMYPTTKHWNFLLVPQKKIERGFLYEYGHVKIIANRNTCTKLTGDK